MHLYFEFVQDGVQCDELPPSWGVGRKARGGPVWRGTCSRLERGRRVFPFGEVGPRSGVSQVPLPRDHQPRAWLQTAFSPLFLLLSCLVFILGAFGASRPPALAGRCSRASSPPREDSRAPRPGGWPLWVRGSAACDCTCPGTSVRIQGEKHWGRCCEVILLVSERSPGHPAGLRGPCRGLAWRAPLQASEACGLHFLGSRGLPPESPLLTRCVIYSVFIRRGTSRLSHASAKHLVLRFTVLNMHLNECFSQVG